MLELEALSDPRKRAPDGAWRSTGPQAGIHQNAPADRPPEGPDRSQTASLVELNGLFLSVYASILHVPLDTVE